MRYVRSAVVALLAAGCTPPAASFTALAGPAREGDLATMQRLIAAGANPNETDPGGNHWTPLLHAIHKEQPAAVDLLIRSGADPTLATANGFSPLLMAVGTGNATIVRRLLAAGADPREDNEIFRSAISGGALSDLDNPLLGRCNPEVVKALLQRAPDLRLRGIAGGRVALLFARLNHCSEVIRLARPSAAR